MKPQELRTLGFTEVNQDGILSLAPHGREIELFKLSPNQAALLLESLGDFVMHNPPELP